MGQILNKFKKREEQGGDFTDLVTNLEREEEEENIFTSKSGKTMGQILNKYKKREEQGGDFTDLVTNLERQLLASNEQVTDLERKLRARDEQVTDLKIELTASNNEVTCLDIQLMGYIGQITDLERQLSARNEQVTDLDGQLSEREEQATDLERQLTNLRRQLSASNEQVTYLDRQLSEREEQATDLQRQLTNLRRQLSASNEQVTYLERQVGRSRELVTTCTLDGTISSENIAEMRRDWEINRNEIITIPGKVLGRGAWGRVTQGKFRRSNVAVKEIHEAILSPHNRMALEREVGIASRCRHPCLLQFIGATNDEQGLLLVTELMDRSLRSLYEERPLTEREISVISLDVAQALNYLHQNKPDPIIHRDISSSNVLLWRQGDEWRGKVSDYGTANFVRQCGIDDTGAAIYCAPEALSGAQDQIISCKVDVYSFGVLLCEMYIRELPEPQQRHIQIFRMKLRRFKEIVERCVQIEPGERPNMEEIIDDLEE